MAYKNSGAMKFNDATDLVIRADPDGTVESVFNLADNVEYINEYSVPVNVTVKINNNLSATLAVYAVYWDGSVLTSRRVNVTSGSFANAPMAKGSKNALGAGTDITVVDGDITIDGLTFTAESDSEISVA